MQLTNSTKSRPMTSKPEAALRYAPQQTRIQSSQRKKRMFKDSSVIDYTTMTGEDMPYGKLSSDYASARPLTAKLIMQKGVTKIN